MIRLNLAEKTDLDAALWHIETATKTQTSWERDGDATTITIESTLWGWVTGQLGRAERMLRALIHDQTGPGTFKVTTRVMLRFRF